MNAIKYDDCAAGMIEYRFLASMEDEVEYGIGDFDLYIEGSRGYVMALERSTGEFVQLSAVLRAFITSDIFPTYVELLGMRSALFILDGMLGEMYGLTCYIDSNNAEHQIMLLDMAATGDRVWIGTGIVAVHCD